MKKLTLSVALAVATVVNAFACTNLIVGKNALQTVLQLFPILPTPMDCSASYTIIPQACTKRVHGLMCTSGTPASTSAG